MALGPIEMLAVKTAIDFAKKVPWYDLWSKFNGKKICIYGPSFAGKTELIQYLMTGKLAVSERKTEGTPYFQKSGALILRFSTDLGPRDLILRFVVDSPGGVEVKVFVKNLIEQRPNFIFFVFDASQPERIEGTRYGGALKWFTEFANECHNSHDIPSKISKDIRGIAVLWNKCDKLNSLQLQNLEIIEQKIKKLAEDKLQKPLGAGRVNIEFFKCCLISGKKFPETRERQSEHQHALDFMLSKLL